MKASDYVIEIKRAVVTRELYGLKPLEVFKIPEEYYYDVAIELADDIEKYKINLVKI